MSWPSWVAGPLVIQISFWPCLIWSLAIYGKTDWTDLQPHDIFLRVSLVLDFICAYTIL